MHDLVEAIGPRTLGLILFGLVWLLFADLFIRVLRILWLIRGEPNAFYTRFTELPVPQAAWALFRVAVALAVLFWLIRAGYVK